MVSVTDSKLLSNLVFFHMGTFEDASSTSPTLFYNDANQHVAKMVETRIANTNSPWLAGVKVGDIHAIPVSHGEGKFVVTAEEFAELRDNGQIFSQYVDFEGNQAWIQNTILTVLSMRLKVSQVRMVKLLGRWDTQNVSKTDSSKIFQGIKINISLHQL